MSIKVFVVHHKASNVFRNEIFEPIQTGAAFSSVDLGFIKDNDGDNIASKNPFYGELTAWYWVLKNWLPLHPEVSYIGFCHYRRILDITSKPLKRAPPFEAITWHDFERKFNSKSYSDVLMGRAVEGYDILLPVKESLMSFRCNFIGNVFDQYTAMHPKVAFERCVNWAIVSGLASAENVRQLLCANSFHSCLNFIMRRDIFESLARWMFMLLDEVFQDLDKKFDLPYNEIRAPAFIAERFFDVWLSQQPETVRVKECKGYLIGDSQYPHGVAWSLSGIKQWLMWKIGLKRHKQLPSIVVRQPRQ